jgi:hypothetical protein
VTVKVEVRVVVCV